jgi:2-dehydro-3-deoxyphosphogluconate aldolase/(4S)-4-hydroxy-2-oxoglutarate aldolase
MNEILHKIASIGIIPVVKLDDARNALPLAKALCAGGLPCVEITYRTAQAKESIRLIAENIPNMLLGAGTVLTTEQVDEAISVGALFIVSPGLNPKVVKYCLDKNITVIPGCSNPSDIEQAIGFGLEVVKIFPAEAIGGLKIIKAMAAPYANMKFLPTGGINQKNLNEYLSYNKVIACGGSWMVNESLINEGKFDEITALTQQTIRQMLGFELAHVGINANGVMEAREISGTFSKLFGFDQKDGNSSVFAGSAVEVMKGPSAGAKGHIAISTNSIGRAVENLKNRGYEFDDHSVKFDAEGNMIAVYFAGEIGGFAVHLLQKK